MPTVTVDLEEGKKTFEVEEGTRLVLALEDNGIDISHRCGGNARCTTCRCKITSGNPSKYTRAEKEKLESGDNLGDFRLSCQLAVESDMEVKPLMRVKDMEWEDPGSRPKDEITPTPEWVTLG